MRVAESPVMEPIFHQNRYAQALGELVFPGCSWLDVGAGARLHDGWIGPSCEELAGRPRYLAGCDVVENITRHPHLHDARVADARSLPWPDDTFDVVSANMVVEHLEEPRVVFAEVRRVLRHGGRFVFVTPNLRHPVIRAAAVLLPPGLRRWCAIHLEKRPARDVFVTHYRCNTVNVVQNLAKAVGFQAQQVEAFVSAAPLLPGVVGRAEMQAARYAARFPAGRARGSNILAVLTRP